MRYAYRRKAYKANLIGSTFSTMRYVLKQIPNAKINIFDFY